MRVELVEPVDYFCSCKNIKKLMETLFQIKSVSFALFSQPGFPSCFTLKNTKDLFFSDIVTWKNQSYNGT